MSLPTTTLHPDFERAPEHQRYRAPDERLPAELDRAARAGGTAWAKLVTPTGLHVAMRVLPTGARQLAIGRDARFVDANEWMAEINQWRRRFGATGWTIEHGETRTGGPRCTLTERVIEQSFFGADDHA